MHLKYDWCIGKFSHSPVLVGCETTLFCCYCSSSHKWKSSHNSMKILAISEPVHVLLLFTTFKKSPLPQHYISTTILPFEENISKILFQDKIIWFSRIENGIQCMNNNMKLKWCVQRDKKTYIVGKDEKDGIPLNSQLVPNTPRRQVQR